MTVRLSTLVLIAMAALAGPAMAQSCTVSVTPVNFGNYSPFASVALDSTGQVTVSCDGVASYVIGLNAGMNGGGNFSARALSNGQSALRYQLYSDGAYTQVWGDGTGGSNSVQNSSSRTLTVYGRIPAHQSVSAGSYSDTILLTVSY